MRRWAFGLFAVLALALSACSGKSADPIPPKPDALLSDQANALDTTSRQQIEADLLGYEQRTTNQIAVLLVKTTGDQSIENYAADTLNKWGVGQADKDNGVLMVLALDDRQGRIEVGYGLEGTLTDIKARDVLEQQVFPLLKNGDVAAAVTAGEQSIRSILGDPSAPMSRAYTSPAKDNGGGTGGWILLGVIGAVIIGAIVLGGRGGGPRSGLRSRNDGALFGTGMGWGMMGGGLGGFGGGGSSGGGFGGFGGFGGGSSGGGGASGSW